MAETWLDNIPGLKDVIDATSSIEVTLPRGHKLVFSGQVSLVPDAVNKRVEVVIGGVAALELSDATPATLSRSTGTAGVGATASRADHRHDISTATAVTLTDATNDEGNSTSLARANHTHSHGSRGGGSLHAVATTGAHGFMSATDKTKLDGITLSGTAAPVTISDSANTEGVATTGARSDHVHSHGTRGGGTLHTDATITTSGFLSAADKIRLTGLGGLRVTGITNAVGGSGATSFTPDFSSLGLQTGDTLFVVAASPAGVTQPGSQGWVQTISLAWSSGSRALQVQHKVWGQGSTDDSTPTFTLAAGDCGAIGFVVRGLRVSGGAIVVSDSDTVLDTDVSGTDDIAVPAVDVNVAGSLVVTVAVHDATTTDPWTASATPPANGNTAYPALRVANIEANNTTLDYTIAIFAQVATIAAPATIGGSMGLVLDTTSDPVHAAAAVMSVEPLTA